MYYMYIPNEKLDTIEISIVREAIKNIPIKDMKSIGFK